MNLTKYLILMVFATLLSWGCFLAILFTVNPFNTVLLGFLLFYLSLFFAITGTLALFGFLIRYFFIKNQFLKHQVVVSFRQAILFSFLVTAGLFLQSKKLIAWWNLLILVFILFIVEVGFNLLNFSKETPQTDE